MQSDEIDEKEILETKEESKCPSIDRMMGISIIARALAEQIVIGKMRRQKLAYSMIGFVAGLLLGALFRI